MLQLTRSGAVKVAADARRQLKALLVTSPEPVRAALRGGTWLTQAITCSPWRRQASPSSCGWASHPRRGAQNAARAGAFVASMQKSL